MRTFKKILSLLPLLILWAMLSIFLWGFVFSHITDTDRTHKITLCVDGEAPRATDLAVLMEEQLEGAVRMVKVRPFSYAMFNTNTLTEADLFLVPASHIEEYLDWFAPLPPEYAEKEGTWMLDGIPYGYQAENPASEYIAYDTEEYGEYYLLFGKQSAHLTGNENAVDNLAVTAAEILLSIQ